MVSLADDTTVDRGASILRTLAAPSLATIEWQSDGV
jgi:hypothetical protein